MPIHLRHSFEIAVKQPSLEVPLTLERQSMLGRLIQGYPHISEWLSAFNYSLSIPGMESHSL